MHGQQCLAHLHLMCQSCAPQITFECKRLSDRGQDGRTGLLAMARDHSAPPTATATGALTASSALRETVTQLGMAIPGEWRSASAAIGLPPRVQQQQQRRCYLQELASSAGLHDLGHAPTMSQLHVPVLI